jgi:cyclophilin family peptidyl-prolyl cis-trans isomerase
MMRRLILAGLLCANVALAQRTAPDSLDVARWAALLRIEDGRIQDTAVVQEALRATSLAVRRAAVRTIGRNRIISLYPIARGILSDTRADTSLRADAAFALGVARDGESCAALEASLVAAPSVGEAAAWALGEIGRPCSGSLRAALAASAGGARRMPAAALSALIEAAAIARVTDTSALVTLAATRQLPSAVRWSALWTLSRLRIPDGADIALGLTRHPDARIVEASARLLALPLVRNDTLQRRVRDTLQRLITHPDAHVRIAAVRALATHAEQDSSARRRLMAHSARERDANVRVALWDVGTRLLGAGDPLLDSLWRRDTSEVTRGLVLRRLAAVDQTRAVVRLAQMPASSREAIGVRARLAALHADSLARHLGDTNARTRRAAWQAIGDASTPAAVRASARPLFTTGMHDPDDAVRETVASLIAQHGDSMHVTVLLDAYRRESAAPNGVDVQLAILSTLGRLRERDSSWVSLNDVRALEWPRDLRTPSALRGFPTLAAAAPASVTPRFHDSTYQRIVREIAWPSTIGRAPQREWQTARGPITVQLHGDVAPLTTWNVLSLARDSYFRALRFHRVVPAFVAQDGDPTGDGSGGPGYAIPDELNRRWYRRGAVGMALSGPDTGGSQYFFTLSPQPHLNGRYTVFGTVTRGHRAMDRLVQGDALSDVVAPR